MEEMIQNNAQILVLLRCIKTPQQGHASIVRIHVQLVQILPVVQLVLILLNFPDLTISATDIAAKPKDILLMEIVMIHALMAHMSISLESIAKLVMQFV